MADSFEQVLESISRVPSAALSFTYRNNIISWLNMQWTMNVASPNRAAEEERAGYLRLVENVVINLVASEIEQHGEGREIAWVSNAERFVVKASLDAGESGIPKNAHGHD